MFDIALLAAAQNQSAEKLYPPPQEQPDASQERQDNYIHYEMDFSEVFPDGPKITVSGSPAMLSGYIGWGTGKTAAGDGETRMVLTTMNSVNLASGTAARSAAASFFASSGDGAAAASLRASVCFDTSYLPGDLAGTIDALGDACRARREQLCAEGGGKAQLDQLDHLREKAGNVVAGSFADLVGGFFRQYGKPEERDRVYDSVLAVSGARAARKGKGGLYTLEELDFAAVSVSACKNLLEDARQSGGVRQQLHMNRLEVETQAMAARGRISGELAELLCATNRTAFREAMASLERLTGRPDGVDLRG